MVNLNNIKVPIKIELKNVKKLPDFNHAYGEYIYTFDIFINGKKTGTKRSSMMAKKANDIKGGVTDYIHEILSLWRK